MPTGAKGVPFETPFQEQEISSHPERQNPINRSKLKTDVRGYYSIRIVAFWAKNYAIRPPKPAWGTKKLHVCGLRVGTGVVFFNFGSKNCGTDVRMMHFGLNIMAARWNIMAARWSSMVLWRSAAAGYYYVCCS